MSHSTPQLSVSDIAARTLSSVQKRLQKTTLVGVLLLMALLVMAIIATLTQNHPLWAQITYAVGFCALAYWFHHKQSLFHAQLQALSAPITSVQADNIAAMLEPLTVVAPGLYAQCVNDIQCIASKKREITYAEFLTITQICRQVLAQHTPYSS